MKATLTTEVIDGGARTGRVDTPGGSFTTPCFMPVGTRGAVSYTHLTLPTILLV